MSESEALAHLDPEAGDPTLGFITPQDMKDAISQIYDDKLDATWVLNGSGNPEGVVTANIGTMYVDTSATNGAIKWIKKSGSGSAVGWQCDWGDTGWRNVSADLINGWTGTLYIRRVGQMVRLFALSLNAASATDDIFYVVTNGFRQGDYGSTITVGSLSGGKQINSDYSSGNTSVPSRGTGTYGSAPPAIWTANTSVLPWPNVLPGTA